MMCLLNPGMRALILRKTLTSLSSTTLVTFREHVAKEALDSGEVKYFGGSGQESAGYKYGNGSVVTIGGMDKSTKIMSSEYDLVFVSEAIELVEDDWEKITTRLRNGKVSFQQLIADTNPDAPHHWLKQRCDRGKTKVIYCQHEDNPALYRDGVWTPSGRQYMDVLDNLTGVRRERLRYGRWAAADGLIYDGFDPTVHLRDGYLMPPREWTRYWAVDFGFTNPFVCQFWCEDPDGRLFMYREIYRTQTLVEDHAKAIQGLMRYLGKDDVKPAAVVCDHDAEGRATLERALGVTTIPAHKSVLEGIEAVKSRLKPAGDGKPRLFLCRDALQDPDPLLKDAKKPYCTQQEVLEYVWANTQKEAPVKANDHGLDAMRYLVAYRDLTGRPNMRTLRWLSFNRIESGTVFLLLTPGCPFAVAWFIVSVVINPVN